MNSTNYHNSGRLVRRRAAREPAEPAAEEPQPRPEQESAAKIHRKAARAAPPRARSQLYQRRFLRPRPHFSAFFKLYIFSFAPFQISVIFQDFCTIFANSAQFLLIFDGDGRFCKFSSNFRRFFSEFRRISVVLTGVMPILLDFREFANFF